MAAAPPSLLTSLWVTRGRSWGFRFLLDGGLDDPLSAYESVFAELGDSSSAYVRKADRVGVRFPDPEGRRDQSGRPIPHDFVLLGDVAGQVASVDQALNQVWPLVAVAYSQVWDRPDPPTSADLSFDLD